MSYLGYIPQTTRASETHIASADGTNTFTLSMQYKPGYLDVFVNGFKVEQTITYPNNPNSPYDITLYPDGLTVGVDSCTTGDVIEFISYSMLYVAGGGGSGTMDPATFASYLMSVLNSNNVVHLDGGTF